MGIQAGGIRLLMTACGVVMRRVGCTFSAGECIRHYVNVFLSNVTRPEVVLNLSFLSAHHSTQPRSGLHLVAIGCLLLSRLIATFLEVAFHFCILKRQYCYQITATTVHYCYIHQLLIEFKQLDITACREAVLDLFIPTFLMNYSLF